MRQLFFEVDGQTLRKNGDFSNIIKGTKNFLECVFDFKGDDWIGRKVIAVFEKKSKEFAVHISLDGTCSIPDDITQEKNFTVKVVGVKGESTTITNRVLIVQEV